MLCCEKCRHIRIAMDLEFREAMVTGDWEKFEKLREQFEDHLRGESAGKDGGPTNRFGQVRFLCPVPDSVSDEMPDSSRRL